MGIQVTTPVRYQRTCSADCSNTWRRRHGHETAATAAKLHAAATAAKLRTAAELRTTAKLWTAVKLRSRQWLSFGNDSDRDGGKQWVYNDDATIQWSKYKQLQLPNAGSDAAAVPTAAASAAAVVSFDAATPTTAPAANADATAAIVRFDDAAATDAAATVTTAAAIFDGNLPALGRAFQAEHVHCCKEHGGSDDGSDTI